jgi:hypothetical protein
MITRTVAPRWVWSGAGTANRKITFLRRITAALRNKIAARHKIAAALRHKIIATLQQLPPRAPQEAATLEELR